MSTSHDATAAALKAAYARNGGWLKAAGSPLVTTSCSSSPCPGPASATSVTPDTMRSVASHSMRLMRSLVPGMQPEAARRALKTTARPARGAIEERGANISASVVSPASEPKLSVSPSQKRQRSHSG